MEFNSNPAPTPNDSDSLWDVLIHYLGKVYPPVSEDIKGLMKQRDEFGIQKYGTPLQLNNGRNFAQDALEEGLDLMVYLYGYLLQTSDPAVAEQTDYLLANALEIVEYLHERITE